MRLTVTVTVSAVDVRSSVSNKLASVIAPTLMSHFVKSLTNITGLIDLTQYLSISDLLLSAN